MSLTGGQSKAEGAGRPWSGFSATKVDQDGVKWGSESNQSGLKWSETSSMDQNKRDSFLHQSSPKASAVVGASVSLGARATR